MRCYFMNNGHIDAVEVLTTTSDEDAISQARVLFQERKHRFEGFELWDGDRVIVRYPVQPEID